MVKVIRKSIHEQNMLNGVFSRCRLLLTKLMEHRHGWIFNNPVDVKGLRAHDYYDVVKNPMDLGTVKCRLEKGRYLSPLEFADDVQQTFHNAIRYNHRGDVAYNMAEELLEIFTSEWLQIEADFAPLFNNIEKIENSSAAATSRKNKGKGKEIARSREPRVSDERYRSWRNIFSEEYLSEGEDEGTQNELPGVTVVSSPKSDESEVHQLKDMLTAAQEKLTEAEENLQNKGEKLAYLESENEALRKTIERLQRESNASLKDFWDGFYKTMSDPTWP